jgi:hypothetical protein
MAWGRSRCVCKAVDLHVAEAEVRHQSTSAFCWLSGLTMYSKEEEYA